MESSAKPNPNVANGFVNGSSRYKVYKYFDDCNIEDQSSNELLVSVTRTLLYASLFDRKSGGDICVFKVNKKEVILAYQRPVLEALCAHYDALASYLRKSLFFLFHTERYQYTHEHDVYVDKIFGEIFPEDYVENVVLKKGK